MNYIEGQIMQVSPDGKGEDFRLKIISSVGKTKWLNLSSEQVVKIERILNLNPTPRRLVY